MPYEGARDGKHYWLTPPDLMAALDTEFHFDFDPCPYPQADGFDGLEVEWGQSNYVNPPFKGPTKWVHKAIKEFKKGKRVVFVFPIDKWIHYLIEAGAEIRNLKDVRWCAIEDGEPGKGMGRWIACFVLDPNKQGTPALSAAVPLGSITDTPAKCPACGWDGRAGQCEPDVDGDGSLGCPRCNAVVACQGDGDPPPQRPGKEPVRTSMLHCGRCGDNLIWPMPGMVVKCTCGAVRVSRDPS